MATRQKKARHLARESKADEFTTYRPSDLFFKPKKTGTDTRLNAMLDRVRSDPTRAMGELAVELNCLAHNRNQQLYRILASIYAAANALLTDDEAWQRFRQELNRSGLRRRKQIRRDMDRDRILFITFEATFARQVGDGYRRGWWYARALEGAFNAGLEAEHLPEFIESRGGLRALYADAVRCRPKRKKTEEAGSDPETRFNQRVGVAATKHDNSHTRARVNPLEIFDRGRVEISDRLMNRLFRPFRRKWPPCGLCEVMPLRVSYHLGDVRLDLPKNARKQHRSGSRK